MTTLTIGQVVKRLRFIKHAKAMGFTLKEMGELLEIRRTFCYRKHQTKKMEDKLMKRVLLLLTLPLLLLSLNTSVYASNIQRVANNPVAAKHVFGVHGLSCPFCVIGIKKTFKRIKGVRSVNVSLKRSRVIIYTNKGICFSDKQLKQIFSRAGFSYHGTLSKPKSCGKLS